MDVVVVVVVEVVEVVVEVVDVVVVDSKRNKDCPRPAGRGQSSSS